MHERKTEKKMERMRENGRTYITDVRKTNILIIAWYEQNCDILLYNYAKKMTESERKREKRRNGERTRKRKRG